MKKWLYVISVGGLTILFSVFYASSRKEARIKEEARLVEAQHQRDKLAEQKAADEKKAREDAEEREAKRRAEEKAKEDEARRKWEEVGKQIQDETNGFQARADKASKDNSRLEIELDTLRKQREKLNREAFDTAKLVERAQVERQTIDLHTQYLLEQIAARASKSTMATPPAPVATAGK